MMAAGALPASTPNDIVGFAASLQDGSALCRLMARIQPGAITAYHEAPKRQFLCFQNISSFLSVCQTALGISQDDLFPAEAVFHASDYQAVVSGLAAVARTPEAARAGLRPFGTGEDSSAALADSPRGPSPAAEDLYYNLESLLEKSTGQTNRFSVLAGEHGGADGSANPGVSAEEDIYGAVVSKARRSRSLQKQAKDKKEKYRFAIMELQETEENFVGVLQTLNTAFRQPLEKVVLLPSTSATPSEIAKVFLNIEQLLAEHSAFLADLQAGTAVRLVSLVWWHGRPIHYAPLPAGPPSPEVITVLDTGQCHVSSTSHVDPFDTMAILGSFAAFAIFEFFDDRAPLFVLDVDTPPPPPTPTYFALCVPQPAVPQVPVNLHLVRHVLCLPAGRRCVPRGSLSKERASATP